MADDILRYTLRVDRLLFRKFRYIAGFKGRSANREIEQHMKRCVKMYEAENGEIILPADGEAEKQRLLKNTI